jgi:hypothetical protein
MLASLSFTSIFLVESVAGKPALERFIKVFWNKTEPSGTKEKKKRNYLFLNQSFRKTRLE